MAYNLQTIRGNLKTLLTAVTGIANVYDTFETNIAGYPAIIFDISNNESEMLTDSENIRKITFTLYVLAEITIAGRDTAKGLLDTVTQNVITALEDKDNMSLSGSVDWIMPTVGARDEFDSTDGVVFSQKLDIVINVASSIL
jgi:hypothetical protein